MNESGGTDPHATGPDAAMARRLLEAPFEVIGRFADASNATLLVRMTDRDARHLEEIAETLGRTPSVEDLDPADLAVYKPVRGEAPLWDFPAGTLHRREVAAHELSSVLGWDLVPTTVLRADGPFGAGSLQRFVPHDPERHYFTLFEEDDPALRLQLVAMVVFDLVIDNADRKGGHVLVEEPTDAADLTHGRRFGGPRLQVVDHGVSFHVERKLRTVAWDFAGEEVPAELRADLDHLREALAGEFGARMRWLLSPEEVDALVDRVIEVIAGGRLPEPFGRRPYPWPLL